MFILTSLLEVDFANFVLYFFYFTNSLTTAFKLFDYAVLRWFTPKSIEY